MTGDSGWSEDLVQEVFFRMLKYRETYRQECGFTTWMYRIARNAHIDQMRKRKWEVALEEGAGVTSIDGIVRHGISRLLRSVALYRGP